MINILTTNISSVDIPISIYARLDGVHDFRKTIIYEDLTLDQKNIFDSFISIINDLEITFVDMMAYDIFLDVYINKSVSDLHNEIETNDMQQNDIDIINNFINLIIQI